MGERREVLGRCRRWKLGVREGCRNWMGMVGGVALDDSLDGAEIFALGICAC